MSTRPGCDRAFLFSRPLFAQSDHDKPSQIRMSQAEASCRRAEPDPLPPNVTSVQPGGGVCYSIELAWGRWRRWWLRTFRPAYVRRMAEKMEGSAEGAPHEVLDPRDLKYCRNLCTAAWKDDPFARRGRIGFARWGLAEL